MSGAEIIVEGLKKIDTALNTNQDNLEKFTQKTTEEIKSVGESFANSLKEVFSGQQSEEIKSLKAELANKDEEIKSYKADIGGINIANKKKELEHKSLISIANSINNHRTVNLESEEYKSISFHDATTTNNFSKPETPMGIFEIVKQPLVTILQDVGNMPAIAATEGQLVWDAYDESLLDFFEANEWDQAKNSDEVKYQRIKLQMRKEQAKMPISADVILNVMAGGNQAEVLRRNLIALENKYNRKIAARVYQDIIITGGKISTATSDLAVARENLRLFPTNLKTQYINNASLYVSRAFINALFSKAVSDGHLPTEQFVFSNGITYFVTPEKLYPVKVFEHNQIGNYKSLSDGSTDITADFVAGGTNTGKLLAFVGDLNDSYKLIPSTMGTVGYDAGIGRILDQTVIAGKISFVAQGLIMQEGVKTLYSSN